MKKYYLLTLTGVALSLVLIRQSSSSDSPSSGRHPITVAASSLVPASRRAVPGVVAAADLAPTNPSATAKTNEDPSSPELQAIFPDLKGRINNWRAFNPETLTVTPFPGMPITFTRVSVKQDSSLTGGHYTTWVGRSASMPGASLVTVGTESGYDALLVVPGNGEINYHVTGSGNTAADVVTSAVVSSELGCGIGQVAARPSTAPHTAGVYAANYQNVAQNVQMPADMIMAADGVPTVDLLYLYDSTMLTLITSKTTGEPVSFLDGQLKVVTETANVFLAQSGITTFKFNYIGVLAAPSYARTGYLQADLTAMNPGGGIGTWLAKTRYDYGADDVCLLVGTSLDYAGLANMNPQTTLDPSLANFVVAGGGGWGPTSNCVSAEVVAHEVGHTLGCNHDRATANIYGDGKYCYGWTSPATAPFNGSTISNTVGTIMSYAPGRIPYYSNPNLKVDIYQELYNPQVNSTAVGSASNPDYGSFTIGEAVTGTDPQYNAKVMADDGPITAGFADPISMPVITQQPAATSVSAGSSLSLSVTASGGGLYYQWSKDGVIISGATAAKFTKSSYATADAGNYAVVITNKAGTATSSTAAVTTATTVTPPPPPPSGGGSSGGGGGGGAMSDWFFGSLALITLIRFRGGFGDRSGASV